MITIVFNFLCGLLYCVGCCFGWSYRETSVYICIYLWPALCVLSTLPISIGLIHRIIINKGRWVSFIMIPFAWFYTSCYILFANLIYAYYNDTIYKSNPFDMCIKDLQQIARECNTTYEYVNIVIYVYLFLFILLVNGILAYIAKPYHNRGITNYIKKKDL